MPNYRGLEALCAFVQTGSVAKAAERLGRTAPQVSRLLSALEDELNLTIFDRTTRPLALTREGRNFALQARSAIEGVDRLDKVALQMSSSDRAHLRILTAPFLARAIVIDAVGTLARQHPEFTAEVDSRIRLDIEDWIERESFDIGIWALPVEHASFRSEHLIDVEILCAMAKDHPLAAAEVVDFDMLVEHDLVLQHPRSRIRTFLTELARQRGTRLKVRFEAPNGLIAAQMAARGLACGLAEPLIAISAGEPDLVLRPFRPLLTVSYGFVFPFWVSETPLMRALVDEMRRVAEARMSVIRTELRL